MKLIDEIKNNSILIITILLITSYHYHIQRNLEAMFFKQYFEYDSVKRPLSKCKENLNNNSTLCIGMPSGHAETMTILTSLLYLYKFIPLWACVILIFAVSLQRIILNVHTIIQVVVGIIFGLCYVCIYKYFNLSIYSFLLVLCIGLLLKLLCIV
jgi:membrane-associated phospholipid phosphatase